MNIVKKIFGENFNFNVDTEKKKANDSRNNIKLAKKII